MGERISNNTVSYEYDGSFEGLLCAMHLAFKNKIVPEDIVADGEMEPSLFQDYIRVATDQAIAESVVKNIELKISRQAVGKIYCAYLSEASSASLAIYNYLAEGLRYGRYLDQFQTNPHVKKIQDLYRKVIREAHRMYGLLRFKVTADNRYYAVLQTDTNVLPLLGRHFQDRMCGVQWIIHDVQRWLAAISTVDDFEVRDFELIREPEFHSREEEFQELWKNYFNRISIKERRNKGLQRQFIPRRYEKFLVETL